MPVLRYHTGGGVYADLPGNIEEVTVSPNQPPVNTDLWVDTDDDSGGTANLLSGYRNVIRNGDMSIRQRGNGPFTITNQAWVPTLDGFRATHSGGNATASAYDAGIGTPGSENAFVMGLVQSSGTGAGNYFHCSQTVEDVRKFAGKTTTFSFIAYVQTGTAMVSLQFKQNFGSGGSPSAQVNVNAGTVTLTTTPTRFTITATLPSISGKVLGTNNDHNIQFVLWVSGGTDYAASNGGMTIQNNTFLFTDFQWEEGGVATPFERIPIQQQLAWCQRYFRRVGYGNASVPTSDWEKWANGFCYGAGSAFITMYFPPMRVAPTSTSAALGPSRYTIAANSQTWEVASLPVDQVSAAQCSWLPGVTPSTLPTGQGCVLMRYGSSPTYIDLSAEL